MAQTPERAVKNAVKKILDGYYPHVYYFMPVTGGYGRSGVPDIVASVCGKFVGIECKANGGKMTALQEMNGTQITNSRGVFILVESVEEAAVVETFIRNLINQNRE